MYNGYRVSLGKSCRGVALTSHAYLRSMLKKEYSYTSTPPLDFHGLLRRKIYLYFDLQLHSSELLTNNIKI